MKLVSEESKGTDGPPKKQPRESCDMCQGTGRVAFALPNLYHEEITCPNCAGGKGTKTKGEAMMDDPLDVFLGAHASCVLTRNPKEGR